MPSSSFSQRRAALVLAALTVVLIGCKSASGPSDATLNSNIQATLAGDSAITGQPVQVAVSGGVATLTGSVSNDAQRTLAARDAAGVNGVQKVVNEIAVNANLPNVAALTASPPAPPQLAPAKALPPMKVEQPKPDRNHPAPIERSYTAPSPSNQPAPQPQPAYQPPPQPVAPPPPAPTFKTVTLDVGATIPVRVTQTLDSGTTQPGTTFSGVVASDIVIDGLLAIPAGSNVTGHVDDVKDAAHFKGSSALTVSLASISRHGEHLTATSDPYTVNGKGRGTNTAEKTGGGAAVGAILGGIFGGGKGAAIGAAAGAGAGAGSNAITRGQQVQIASESVVRFHLSAPISVKVRSDGGEHHHDDDGALQPRQPQ